MSDFPLSKQRTLSEFLLRKKRFEKLRMWDFYYCASAHTGSPSVLRMAGAVSIGLLFCWRKTTQVREMQQAKQASWERATSGLRASERRGRSQGAHGYWLDGLGRCVCGCVSWFCGWWVSVPKRLRRRASDPYPLSFPQARSEIGSDS